VLVAISSPGVVLITCTYCGKENQDHYKFCLGCGSELAKSAPNSIAAPPHATATRAEPAPEIDRAAVSPDGGAIAGELRTPAPAVQKPRGGIPWNDSPKMPVPVAFSVPDNAHAPATAAPRANAPNANNVAGTLGAAVTPGPVPSFAPRPTATTPAAATPLPESVTCPNCGKPVQAGFAFCGACGTRIGLKASGPTASASGTTAANAAAAVLPRGRLILIRPDGSEGGSHPLLDGENQVGRGQGPLFDADAYLSPRHAELSVGPNGITVRDLQSLNGIFLKIREEEELESGDVFRIGQELLRFEVISPPQPFEDGTEIMGTPNPGFWGRLSVIVGRDVDGSAFPLFGESVVLGRERGDILFPEDGYVSGTHTRISLREERVYLTDLGSSNGTFLRLRHERTVPTGSFMLMGQQLFRLEFR
jgi:hypothetical protein